MDDDREPMEYVRNLGGEGGGNEAANFWIRRPAKPAPVPASICVSWATRRRCSPLTIAAGSCSVVAGWECSHRKRIAEKINPLW